MEVISLGCNEVPTAGGGTYWTGDSKDQRDFQVGHDSNAKIKGDLITDLLKRLKDAGWLNDSLAHLTINEIIKESTNNDNSSKTGPLHDSMVADIIEFGRMVHAEMNAITEASRFGRPTTGGTLFCTVLPCHMCAKIIVAAGIQEVIFFQPYYKSLIRELYPDSISIDESGDSERVMFRLFLGVTPKAFQKVFKKGRRKTSDGRAMRWNMKEAQPLFVSSVPFYLQLEAVTGKVFSEVHLPLAAGRPHETPPISGHKG
jgi:cytidine deaminase